MALAYEPGVKERIVDMATNGSGVRDTSRVLGIGRNTVTSALKKKSSETVDVNPYVGARGISVEIGHLFDFPRKAQADELWSYVGKKENRRWLRYAIDAATGCVLSFVFGRRKDEVCKRLVSKLEKAFDVRAYYTEDWGSHSKFIPKEKHVVGKRNTQKIENENLLFRTRIKRLARKTICFSKSEIMHDTVIGLFINRYCFQI